MEQKAFLYKDLYAKEAMTKLFAFYESPYKLGDCLKNLLVIVKIFLQAFWSLGNCSENLLVAA